MQVKQLPPIFKVNSINKNKTNQVYQVKANSKEIIKKKQ